MVTDERPNEAASAIKKLLDNRILFSILHTTQYGDAPRIGYTLSACGF
jgi:hypothetical protein